MVSDTLRPPVVQYSSIHWRTLSCSEKYSFVQLQTADGQEAISRPRWATVDHPPHDRRAIPRRASFQANLFALRRHVENPHCPRFPMTTVILIAATALASSAVAEQRKGRATTCRGRASTRSSRVRATSSCKFNA
jgi:hypothetical protein